MHIKARLYSRRTLKAKNHRFTDLYAFYNSYLDKVLAFNASKHSEKLDITEATKELLEQIALSEAKVTELKNKIKKRLILTIK